MPCSAVIPMGRDRHTCSDRWHRLVELKGEGGLRGVEGDLGGKAAVEGESIQPVWQTGIKAIRLTPPLPAGLVHHTEGACLAAHICQSHLCGAPPILQKHRS